jgi:signal transduction histidine kinase
MNDYQERLIESRTEELTQRSRELEMANYELRKVDNLKTAVLNTVSHDLRTPLTSVLGFCKIIDRDFKRYFLPMSRTTTDLEARGARITFNLGIIETEGERLTRLINDFLDLSQIEAGEIAWNDISVDPRELLMQAKPVLEGYFSMSGVSLNMNFTGTLPHVTADPDRLLQVFNNLIGNAAKFTSYGQVDVNASTTEGGWLKISISDTGVGIPHDEIAHIFDNFYQVSRNKLSDNVQRGSGMGLAITRRIIEHYGGSIYVCSEQDKGSIFTFTIPSAG